MIVFFHLFTQVCFADADIELDVTLSKSRYVPGDTVIGALQVTIPPKYHLYGNPLGPGIGKPLAISADESPGVRWLSITKENAERFSPLIGDWVWAYENSALFFIKGIIDTGISGTIQGSFTIDGLICHTACIPVNKKAPFLVVVVNEPKQPLHFSDNDELLKEYNSYNDTMSISTESPIQSAGLKGVSLKGITLNNSVVENTPAEWNYSPVEKNIEFNLIRTIFGDESHRAL